MTTIYHAEGQSEDRNFHIGYYAGNPDDIRAYVLANHNVAYGLELKPINIVSVPSYYAKKYEKLFQQKAALAKKIAELDREIKNL